MAGIGDIVAIAELGYKFAEGLKSYIDEVGVAQESIKALVIEVEQASNHVQGLSQLIEGDKSTGFLTPVGLKECQRLSFAFRETIFEFRTRLLVSNTTEDDPEKVAAEFLNLSRWRKWHWPIFRRTLEEPRARLGELKLELQLLMVTATAHKLSKMPLTQEVERKQEDAHAKLKRLTKTKEKAASRHRKAQAKQSARAPRARSASPGSPSTTLASSDSSFSSDDDMLEYFVEFLDAKKQTAELERRQYQLYLLNQELETREKVEREKRLLARAEQMEKEAEKQRRKEEAKKEALDELERERVFREQIQQKKVEQKEMMRGVMEDAGFEEGKIKEVMDKIEEVSDLGVHFDPVPFLGPQITMAEKPQTAGSIASESQAESSSRQSGLRKGLFKWRNSTTSSTFSDSAGEVFSSSQQPVLEAWSLEIPRMRVPLPVATLLQMIKKQDSKSLMKSLTSLPKACREEFHNLIEEKNLESSQYLWQLVGIDVTKQRVRIGLFSYSEGAMSVVVVLQRHESGTSGSPTGSNTPRVNRGGGLLSSDTTPPMQKLPSILKKPTTSAAPPKQSEIAPTTESRVRISSESPEINYTNDTGTQDSIDDHEPLEGRPRKPYPHRLNVPQPPAAVHSTMAKEPEIRFDSDSEDYDRESTGGIRSRQRSRSRESRTSFPRYPGANYFEDDYYGLSPFKPIPRDDYTGVYSQMGSYLPPRSRSRSRSGYNNLYMPSIDEHIASRASNLGAMGESFPYQPGERVPPRRYSTLDSLDYYRDSSPGRRPIPNIHIYNNTDRYTSPGSRSRSPEDWKLFDDDLGRGRRSSPLRSPSRDRRSRELDEIIIRRRPSPPPPMGLRSDSIGYHRSAPYGPQPGFPANASPRSRESRSPRRRRSSPDWYDIKYPRRRIFVGDSKGDNQISSPTPTRRTTLSPERGRGENEMALVLRSHFANEDFEKLKKRAKKQARKHSSVRKKSGDDYNSDDHDRRSKRGHGKGRKATIEEYDESDNAASDVLDKYQSMFNPNYEPPVTNGTSDARTVEVSRENSRNGNLWDFGGSWNVGLAATENKGEEDDTWGGWGMTSSKKKKKKKKKKAVEDDEAPPPPQPPEHEPKSGDLEFPGEDDWGVWATSKKAKKKNNKINPHPPEGDSSTIGISQNVSTAPKGTAAWAVSDDEPDDEEDLEKQRETEKEATVVEEL
ncbi:hypothetical protein B0J12DRAFT_703333 [Macrophomina phaseolina]|uniref:Uncharacterized protein n=1 Tax=Macrophomina phaseolina TaxID=35725 RepID=A0ABQ8G1X1_9PEZI|nr:hypothetical protein B0J12DRAFT_703333 [Macrophomina phaseolina]